MFHQLIRANIKRRRLHFGVLLCLAAFAPPAFSQMGGIDSDADPGTGGKNSIQGSIYYPSGRRVDKRVKVTLSSISRSEMYTMSDDSGAFSFGRLAGGTYTITVDAGKEYEVVVERVDIMQPQTRRGQSGQNITVPIQLRIRAGSQSKSGVVNAALAGVPDKAVELYQKAQESARAGNSKQAIEQLKLAIDIYPQFSLAFNELGVQYLVLGQLSNAEDAFSSAVKIAPDFFDARLNYGIALVYLKRYNEAVIELRDAVSKNDSSAAAHAYLGRALATLRKLGEGEMELQRAISLAGDELGWVYRYLGGIYFERHDNQRTIVAMEKYLKLVPNASDAAQVRELLESLRAQVKAQRN